MGRDVHSRFCTWRAMPGDPIGDGFYDTPDHRRGPSCGARRATVNVYNDVGNRVVWNCSVWGGPTIRKDLA